MIDDMNEKEINRVRLEFRHRSEKALKKLSSELIKRYENNPPPNVSAFNYSKKY